MSTWPSVQFVASPDAGATVLLDLNEDPIRTLHDEFSLGMAELGGEPGSRGRQLAAIRDVSVPLQIHGDRALARQMLQILARQAVRDGWLRIQLDAASDPVWFRVDGDMPSALDWSDIYNDGRPDRWHLSLPLKVSALGMGAEVTLPDVTITNDPRHASFAVVLPEIVGEMPAPAKVKLSSSSWMLGPGVATLAAAHSLTTAANWSANVTATADAGYMSTSGRRETDTSALWDDWKTVCTFTPATMPPDSYRALIRVSASTNVGAWQVRWVVSSPSAASSISTPPVTVSAASMRRWIDTGRVPVPLTDGTALGGSSVTVLTLQARRAGIGGQLRFDDRLLLLPSTDATLLKITPDDVGAVATVMLADSEDREVSMLGGGQVARPPDFAGGWPILRPGEPNRLLLLQNLDPRLVATRDDLLTATATVTVSYRPRYLWGV